MLLHYFSSLRSPDTLKTYKSHLNKFALWLKDCVDVEDFREVMTIDIGMYKSELIDQGLKPATINDAISTIETFYNWMISEGHIAFNPAAQIQKVEAAPNPPRWLTDTEQFWIIRAISKTEEQRNYCIVLTLLLVGLRSSEVINLTPDDVVITKKKGTLLIRAAGRRSRLVLMPKALVNVLGKYTIEERALGDWLFPSTRGEKLTIRAVQHVCKAVGLKAGIKELTPQMLRNTCIRSLMVKGVNPVTVAKQTGFARIDPIFAQQDPEDIYEAVEKLNIK